MQDKVTPIPELHAPEPAQKPISVLPLVLYWCKPELLRQYNFPISKK